MEFFVYIIHTEKYDIFYKGFTTNPQKRLWEHNNNLSRYTAGKGPWNLVFLQKLESKKQALIAERKLKRVNTDYLKVLIQSDKNLIRKED